MTCISFFSSFIKFKMPPVPAVKLNSGYVSAIDNTTL